MILYIERRLPCKQGSCKSYIWYACLILISVLKDMFKLQFLLQETIRQCKMGGSIQSDGEEPKPLCSAYEQPDKATAIQQHKRVNLVLLT